MLGNHGELDRGHGRAQKASRKQGCDWCGRNKKLKVHHIEPVSVAPDKADDTNNMIMLCRKPACHQIIGHDGDFGSRYVENVKDICKDSDQRVVKIQSA